ncbi:hypothetical protein CLF_102166 [Clonorchis sinensis]|uniref:Uncharacterized protein n=1 Tax=Clonorchis sinensis TaxID=79923 RepID=G7Y7E3_CLOSI|nr:hypothetical protein CLF_102166 [Clonorchis sinensis]
MDFQLLYGAYVRPLLGYTNLVVYSGRMRDLTLIERVQRAATKMDAALNPWTMKLVSCSRAKKAFSCTTLSVPNCHDTGRKHEGWDNGRLPKSRRGRSRGRGRVRTTDFPVGISASILKPRRPIYLAASNSRTLKQAGQQAALALTLDCLTLMCAVYQKQEFKMQAQWLNKPPHSTGFRLCTSRDPEAEHNLTRRIIRRQVKVSVRVDHGVWWTLKAKEMEEAQKTGSAQRLFQWIPATDPRKPPKIRMEGPFQTK